MSNAENEYLGLLRRIRNEGTRKQDRTGTGTLSLFGPQIEFDLQEGFPLLDTKKLPFRVIAEEWNWFKNGDTNLKTLLEKNVNIWNGDAYRDYLEKGGELSMKDFLHAVRTSEEGYDLGPIYGEQWRHWVNDLGEVVDQLKDLIENMKKDPDSRRHYVTAINPGAQERMALPACHAFFQMYIADGKVSCKMYQRSADMFLGVPFNIASYALKTYVVAKMLGLEVGKLILTFGDAHIYLNHIAQVNEQLERTPKEKLPQLEILTVHESIDDYTIDDYKLTGYDPQPRISGEVSVGL